MKFWIGTCKRDARRITAQARKLIVADSYDHALKRAMSDRYILNSHGKPVPEPDLMKWAIWFEKADRTVALTRIGAARVSTVFLGLDHRFMNKGDPIFWETMVFGGPLEGEMERCSGTREDAALMHVRMVERVGKEMNLAPGKTV